MDKNDILKNVYKDFFGDSSDIAKNEKELDSMLQDLDNSMKKTNSEKDQNQELNNTLEQDNNEKTIKKEKIDDAYKFIDNLYIDENSKQALKKIVEYMKKYFEKSENQFIPFNLCVYCDSEETVNKICAILNGCINYYSYMPYGDASVVSFYDIEKPEKIDEVYNSKHNCLLFKNFEAFSSMQIENKKKIAYKISDNITEKKSNVMTIFYAKNKDELNEIFSISDKLKTEFSKFEIIGIKPDIQDINQEILSKLENNVKIDDDFKIKLLDYISATYTKSELPYSEYRDNLCEKIIFDKNIPEYEKDKTMEEIFAELNDLVGLQKVKKMLKELVDLMELKNKMKDDLKMKNINLHMVFLGNPRSR